jgi:formate-dependent nitrite reductase membrane component NrfD
MAKRPFQKEYENTMEAHEWMVRSTYQTEWITRQGIFLWLAMYAGGLGGGLYLVSLYFNSFIGMLVSLLIVAGLKGGFHFAYLGKPLRFWRILFRPKTSWLTRGFIFVVLFVGFAAIQLMLSFSLPGTPWEVLFKVLTGLMAIGVIVYTGFVLNTVKAVSLWNSPLLPLLFAMCGLLGGFGLSTVIALYGGHADLHAAETGSSWLLVINFLLIAVYLWRTVQKDETGKKSVMDQMRGKVAPAFWIGVIGLGIAAPLAVTLFGYFSGEVIPGILIAGVICEITGGLSLRYCLLKVGIYKPLFPRPSYLRP